jgi:hypothetical protein
MEKVVFCVACLRPVLQSERERKGAAFVSCALNPDVEYLQSSKDLVCLQKFELVEVYTSINWRKHFKAPTEFGFALKVNFCQ